jgi:hypothetical protein
MSSYNIKHKTTRYIALEILVLTWDRHKYIAELNHDHIPANEKNDIIDKNTLYISQKRMTIWTVQWQCQ